MLDNLLPKGRSLSLDSAEKGCTVCEKKIVKKLNRHILVKFFVMTMLCYIDRTNLAFAALQLNQSLGFSEVVYGLGSSIFFIGYSAFQIPSNLMLVRLGAPTWLSIIIVSWGIVATSFAGLKGVVQFYALRLLLGITESGTFPGMWYHMSLFYSEREMGVAYSWVNAGTALSQVFGAPIAAILLSLDGVFGLKGWQWLFVVEGLPTVVLGVWVNRALAETPLTAHFLKPDEAEWLHQRQQKAKPQKGAVAGGDAGAWAAVWNWRTWYLAIVALLEALIKNSIIYWAPLIIASMVGHEMSRPPARALSQVTSFRNITVTVTSVTTVAAPAVAVAVGEAAADHSGSIVALLTALPFGSAAVFMLVMAKHSAATGERKYHSTIPFVLATFSLGTMAWLIDSNPVGAFGAMLGATVLWGPAGIINALPATFLSGPAAATGVALINSIANVGGMLGPYMIGALRQHKSSYQEPIAVLAFVAALTAGLVWFFPMDRLGTDSRGSVTYKHEPQEAAAVQKPQPQKQKRRAEH